MPIYEYKCEDCGYTFDKLVNHHDTDVNCTICQGDSINWSITMIPM
jgi:putative FmdB family regulatory protein